MSGNARRDQIVQVATRLFSQRGFRGTTTKEIANAAGISEAMIFRHFKTKRDLYSAILDYAGQMQNEVVNRQRILEAAEDHDDDRVFFERLALAMFERSEKTFDFTRLLLFSALEGHELAKIFVEKYLPEKEDFIGNYIRIRQEQGYLRKIDQRHERMSFEGIAFASMVLHMLLIKHLFDTNHTLINISNEEASKLFAELFLYGVAAPRLSDPRLSEKRSSEKRSSVQKKTIRRASLNNGAKVTNT